MKTLNWRHTDWSARHFIFSVGEEIIGQLTFYSSWNFNAEYTDKETKLRFSQKGVWNSNVLITREEERIGEIESGFFKHPTLRLTTGEKFILSANVWGRDVSWKSEKGETIINYEQATWSSMGKGRINLTDSLSPETEKLLISSGLYIRKFIHKRAAVVVAMAIPILAASNS